MFAAVVREGMFVRLPSGRIACIEGSVPGEPGFFDFEYVDNGQKGTAHCRLMRHATAPKDFTAGPASEVSIRSTLDPEVVVRNPILNLKRNAT